MGNGAYWGPTDYVDIITYYSSFSSVIIVYLFIVTAHSLKIMRVTSSYIATIGNLVTKYAQ